jgi:hypothetical protein
MANDPFSREIINVRERPLSSDTNIAESYLDRSLRDFIRALLAPDPLAVVTGFLNQSFKVVATTTPSMTVNISPGLGFIDDASDVPTAIGGVLGVNDVSTMKPLPLSAVQPIVIDGAPSAGNSRYDIIEVKCDRRSQDPTSRDILDPATGVFAPNLVNKTLAFYLDGRNARVVSPAPSTTGIGYKVGVAATSGTEVVPATTAGYVKIAEIHVVSGVTTITNSVITDTRPGSGLALLLGNNAFLGNNTFAGTSIFNAAVTIAASLLLSAGDLTLSAGNIAMTRAALQSILKGGTGGFDIGTSIASDLRVLLNNVAQWTFRASDGALLSNSKQITGLPTPVAASDGANKGYVDGLTTRAAPALSATCGAFVTASASYVDVTNLSVTIVTHGRPVVVTLVPDGSGNGGDINVDGVSVEDTRGVFAILQDTVIVHEYSLGYKAAAPADTVLYLFVPPSAVSCVVVPSAGSHVYKVQAKHITSGRNTGVSLCKLLAYEI